MLAVKYDRLNTYINFCFFLKLQKHFDKAINAKDKWNVDCGDSTESETTKQSLKQMNKW